MTVLNKTPFALPARLSPDLERVRGYWRGLLRGSAKIPFVDDVSFQDLPDLKGRLFLIEAFSTPLRFRVGLVGAGLGADDLAGRFLDETHAAWPFEYLPAQCDATLEAAAPTYFHHDGDRPYARMVLPLWGDGRVSSLLGVVEPA